MSFPPATEMFQFAGFASHAYEFSMGYPLGWVAPFGDPGINDRSHLPRAFRSVPRPSSPLSAKASTRCPYLRLSATPNGKNHSPDIRSQISESRSTGVRQTLLLRRHFVRDTPQQLGESRHGRPARSHNSLLYDVTSAKCPRLPITGMQTKACLGFFSPRLFTATWRRRLSRFGSRKPLSARQDGAAHDGCRANIGGGGDRARTDDPLLAKQVLSQLSYTPLQMTVISKQ